MTTPNMNLTLPVVSQTPGPTWASEINADLSLVDSHNHTSGKGVLVPVAGLDINADLSLATHSLTNASSVVLLNQASLATLNALYAESGQLFWNDGAGHNVQITINGHVNVSGTGNISGMIGSASVTYTPGPNSYVFLDQAGAPAGLNAGSISLGNSSGINRATIASALLTSNYTMTLPASLPVSGVDLMGLSSTGAISNVVPDSTLTVTSSSIGVATGGIQTANIAAGAVTGTLIASSTITSANMAPNSIATASIIDGAVTREKQAAVGGVLSTSSGNYTRALASAYLAVTNLHVSYNSTTTRPILLLLQPDNSVNLSTIYGAPEPLLGPNYGSLDVYINVTKPDSSTEIIDNITLATSKAQNQYHSPSSVQCVYVPSATGTYTFEVWAKEGSGGSIWFSYVKLLAIQY